ncbi:MAG: DUF4913 domain-containing protein [Actinobacteria bacterium]|nr:DUF4913 domain-containing protein [Actinomycetota bacterium]
MSVWCCDHVDHHMPALLSPNGPFAAADDQHKRGQPLSNETLPGGLFPDMCRSH